MKERLVKAILICPYQRIVREVEHNANDYREIHLLLSSMEHKQVDLIDAVRIDEHEAIYVDDEGLYGATHFFMWKGYHQPLAGRGLVLGSNDDGETVSTKLTAQYVMEHVQFTDKIRVAGWQDIPEGTTTTHPLFGDKPVAVVGSRPVFRPVDPDED